MAINFASVVPRRRSTRPAPTSAKAPSAPAPTSLGEWTLGQRLVFRRTPTTGADASLLDSITFEFGQEPIVALLRLQNGEVDVPGDGIPPAQFVEGHGRPGAGGPLVEGGQLHTGYVTMNVKTRRSTIGRPPGGEHGDQQGRIARSSTTGAVPATEPLPPSMTEATPRLQGLRLSTPKRRRSDARRRRLADGFDELYAYNTDPNPRIAQAIQQDLAAIGISPSSNQSLAQANGHRGRRRTTGPDDLVRRHGVDHRLPRPSNFYGPILGCGGAVQGGWNWSCTATRSSTQAPPRRTA